MFKDNYGINEWSRIIVAFFCHTTISGATTKMVHLPYICFTDKAV